VRLDRVDWTRFNQRGIADDVIATEMDLLVAFMAPFVIAA